VRTFSSVFQIRPRELVAEKRAAGIDRPLGQSGASALGVGGKDAEQPALDLDLLYPRLLLKGADQRSEGIFAIGGEFDLKDRRCVPLDELLSTGLGDQPAVSEDCDLVADPLHVRQDVGREKDGGRTPQGLDEGQDIATADGVESGRRLVEKDHGRSGNEGLSEPQPLAHSTRIATDAAVRSLAQPCPGQHLVNAVTERRTVETGQSADEGEELASFHPAIDMGLFGQVAKVTAGLAAPVDDGDLVNPGLTGGGLGQAGEQFDGRRFPGAVGSEEAKDDAGLDGQVEAVEGHQIAVLFGQVDASNRWLAHVSSRPVTR
jgi:hypothetical protein